MNRPATALRALAARTRRLPAWSGPVARSARRSWTSLLLGLAALVLLGLLSALLTLLAYSSPPLATILLTVVLAAFVLVVILAAPVPGLRFEQFGYFLLLVFSMSLMLWPRYALLRIPGLFGVSPARVALAVLLLVWFYLVLRSTDFRHRLGSQLAAVRPLAYSMLIVCVFKLLGLISSPYFILSFKGVLNEILTAYLLFPIALSLMNSERRVRRFFLVLGVSGVVAALLGLYESTLHHNLFLGYLEIDSEYLQRTLMDKLRAGAYRIQSTFSHPLTFSEFLAMLTPLLAMAAFNPPRQVTKGILLALLMPLFLYVILKSGSRSGAVAFAFSATVMLTLVLYRNARVSRDITSSGLMVIGALFVLAAAAVVGYAMADFVVGRTIGEERSGYARVAMWLSGLEVAAEQPFIGHGQDMGAHVLGYAGGDTIDSYYLSVLLENGVVALIAYCFMLGYTIAKGTAFGISAKGLRHNLAIGISTAVIAFAAIKLVLSLSHNHGILFVLMGVLFQVISWQPADARRPAGQSVRPPAPLAGARPFPTPVGRPT